MTTSTPPRPTVEFFFCLSCPWTYLAFARLHETALRTGAAVVYRPILSAWLPPTQRDALRYPWLSQDPAIRDYGLKDLQDWAHFCGLTIALPDPWPVRPEWAQRVAVLAADSGLARPYLTEAFAAHFTNGLDISRHDVAVEVAARVGLAGDSFEARLADETTLTAIRRNTEELQARRGIGSPSMFLGDDLYFGHDRMPLLEVALMSRADRPFIAPGEHARL